GRGLRFWDDLFAAVFAHHAAIHMEVVNTEKGVRVVETSHDPLVVGLIQAHAKVVSQFVENGFAEAHKNHEVPAAAPEKQLAFPIISGFGGVVTVPNAAEGPQRGAKVVFDVTAGVEPEAVNKGLERVARLLNLYGAGGLKA